VPPLKDDELRDIARAATRSALNEALGERTIPRAIWQRLALEEGDLTTGQLVFQLYFPRPRSADAVIVSRAIVQRDSGRVAVEVFVENLLAEINEPEP